MKSNEDLALEMANYILLDQPIPDSLIDDLMKGVCEEVKQERERCKGIDGQAVVGEN